MGLIIEDIVGFGCDNAKVNTGAHNGLISPFQKSSPFMIGNGCFGHLFALTNKHSFEELNHLNDFDLLIKKGYKYFSKRPKKLIDLQNWYKVKGLKFHKLLNIFDVRWLSRGNSVNSFRRNLPAVLDTLLSTSKDVAEDKKNRNKALNLYQEFTTFENLFLIYSLCDILDLCCRFSKTFQSDEHQLYSKNETIQDLIKCLTDGYLGESVNGIYFQEFQSLLLEIKAGKNEKFKDHNAEFKKWVSEGILQTQRENKMIKVLRALSQNIIENLKKYFPDSGFIHDTWIFDIESFLKKHNQDSNVQSYGNSEILRLSEHYGEIKKQESRGIGSTYLPPLINSEKVIQEWPYFKLMLLNNFENDGKSKNKDYWKHIFRTQGGNFPQILKLAQLIFLIPSNSCSCERGKLFISLHKVINFCKVSVLKTQSKQNIEIDSRLILLICFYAVA